MINDQDLALLATKLEIPLIIRHALEAGSELDDETQYGLHECLSDMKPDSALLSIALSARMIARAYPDTEVLVQECERILHEYGPLWLENAKNGAIDSTYLVSLLENIPADLENLTELLEINLSYAALESAAISQICDIFQIQASAHAIIAEEFLSLMDIATHYSHALGDDLPQGYMHQTNSDNIVPFRA